MNKILWAIAVSGIVILAAIQPANSASVENEWERPVIYDCTDTVVSRFMARPGIERVVVCQTDEPLNVGVATKHLFTEWGILASKTLNHNPIDVVGGPVIDMIVLGSHYELNIRIEHNAK